MSEEIFDMWRFWIKFCYAGRFASGTVDVSAGDLEAGMDPVSVFFNDWQLLQGRSLVREEFTGTVYKRERLSMDGEAVA